MFILSVTHSGCDVNALPSYHVTPDSVDHPGTKIDAFHTEGSAHARALELHAEDEKAQRKEWDSWRLITNR